MKTIERVRLSEIKPNEGNPRTDFGDIGALADSIRATGGEPVNPIVCVRDGGVLFIVDGERRYRALKEIHGGEDPEVSVTVVDGWKEGNEVLAMLATDNKKRLSEAEMSRGYQLSFDLGADYLDDAQIAMATGAEAGKVAGARAAWGRLGKEGRERFAQCSLDQFAAAQEFDGKDFEAILKAKPEQWRTKVDSMRFKKRQDELAEKAADLCALIGVEWIRTRNAYEVDGMQVITSMWGIDGEDGLDRLEKAVKEHGATAVAFTGSGFFLLKHKAGKDAEADEAARILREERERAMACARKLAGRLMLFAAHSAQTAALRRHRGENRPEYRIRELKDRFAKLGAGDEDDIGFLLTRAASFYELADWLSSLTTSWGTPDWAPGLLAAAVADGYEPTEDDEWLKGYLEREGAGK